MWVWCAGRILVPLAVLLALLGLALGLGLGLSS